MHPAASEYVKQFATDEPVSVIEIGSRNINGTIRGHFPQASWTGIDLYEGPDVDIVCNAAEWMPPAQVDLVICCEVLEHAANWRDLINAAAKWLKPRGRVVITCAGPGRDPHSAIDGKEVRPGEHYQNLTREDLSGQLVAAGMIEIRTEYHGNDTRATAVKPQ